MFENPNTPSVDNNTTVISDPVNTASTPVEDTAPVAPVADDAPTEDIVVDDAPANEAAPEVVEEPAVDDAPAEDTPPVPVYDGEHFKQLMEDAKYTPAEVEANFLDEYGNFDMAKYGEFMKQNNESIFEQATKAVLAKVEAQRIEQDLWQSVHTDFPEIKENETLDKSLRGARLQDILSGGDGDLHRLAKEIVGPIRDSKIAAVESVNRKVHKQESIAAATPKTATPEKAEPSPMQLLNEAIRNGDTDRANQIRHAIRKERIYGKSDNVN